MTEVKECPCGMFTRVGSCYHMGYKPTFSTPKEPTPHTPLAFERSRVRALMPEELKMMAQNPNRTDTTQAT